MTQLFAAMHESASGPSRQFAATQQFDRFLGEADMEGGPAVTDCDVNDPMQIRDVQCNRPSSCRISQHTTVVKSIILRPYSVLAVNRMQFNQLRRREFITLLGGAAAWPLAARAQQQGMPVIGFLNVGSAGSREHLVRRFWQGLNEAGYYEGQNVAIEYRWANEQVDRLPALAADLVRRQVSVIVTPASTTASGFALSVATAATATIPIVFGTGDDPVKAGLVASLNRPGGNLTGVYYLTNALLEKRLGLLRGLVPSAPLVVVLINPKDGYALTAATEMEAAANRIGQKVEFVHASNGDEIDTAFASLSQSRANAFSLIADPLFFGHRVQIVMLVNRIGIPAIFTSREFTEAGGLMSYGTDLAGVYRQIGVYVGRVLKGANPAMLPVEQSTKFEFVVNLQSAKALRLDLPPTLLALADEVIE
jgi:putative tryptophan/tyrosine transport system substrate-binding protein